MALYADNQCNDVDVSAVDCCTGGAATAIKTQINASPATIHTTAAQRLQTAEHYVRIITDLNSATQSLQNAWSGGASESAVAKITSTIGSFMRIVDAMEQGAALLHVSAGFIASAQAAYKAVFSWVNPTVARAISTPYSWEFGEALATGSVASVSTYVTGVQAALAALGAGKMMQQVVVLAAVMMDIEQLAQGNGNAASDASALIGLFRAGQQEYNIQNSPLNQAMNSPQGDPSTATAGDA